ncbi:hypothetical protein AVEN_75151-1 [Araneus ventricosus]|uniref:Integrase zinc-binding domain-containing protein n=1 Tax=Araneus ventricosus TaxID=182803 RepID=A0A4Y2MW83_ARAVE|nr:hypothetical protein AVEN_75151-1 [Araneus ventricosus]
MLVIPEGLTEGIKSLCHEGTSAHLRSTKTKDKLSKYLYWPGCYQDIEQKKFVCHHSSFSKVPSMKNKKGISKNAECLASIKVKIKLDTTRTRMTDKFIGRGLVGVITITPFHKHSLMTAETLRFLPAEECREQFENYFNDGMGPAESAKYHKGVLEMDDDFQPSDLASSRVNPTQRTIEYWHEKWRLLNLGPRNGHGMIEVSYKI